MFEATKKREGDKRKREQNRDPSDIDGYLGPWGKFVDEQTVMKPDEVSVISVIPVTSIRSYQFIVRFFSPMQNVCI